MSDFISKFRPHSHPRFRGISPFLLSGGAGGVVHNGSLPVSFYLALGPLALSLEDQEFTVFFLKCSPDNFPKSLNHSEIWAQEEEKNIQVDFSGLLSYHRHQPAE